MTYDNGYFVRATTRGNGEIGEDVTAQVKTIKTFPLTINYKGKVEVKGEAIIRLSVLDEYNKTADEPLKNARNAVAGAIRNLDPKVTEKRKPEIYFYDINYIDSQEIRTQCQAVEFLKENGFKVFDFLKVCDTIEEVQAAIDEVNETRKSLDVLTDGAVIKVDDYSAREELGSTAKFPRWAIAYKFEAEEVTTILREVGWQIGRTGKLTPLGYLDPVELCGATVRKATLNNYGDILRKSITVPCRVLVRRSNEVIPEILGSTENFADSKIVEKPSICPYCKSALIEVGANLFCPNEDCKPRVIGAISNFASKDAMNIEGFSEMTASMLYDACHLRRFSDLYRLTYDDVINLEGFQQKRANNLIESLNNSKKCALESFIYAIGIDGIGKKTAKDLAKKFKSLDGLMSASREDLLEINEIGEILADNIYSYFNDEKCVGEIKSLLELGISPSLEDVVKGATFAGQKVVLTGTLNAFKRSEAQKIIESLGGEVMSSVSKLTTLVVAGAEAGSKLTKAQSLKIKIIDENEFVALINT